MFLSRFSVLNYVVLPVDVLLCVVLVVWWVYCAELLCVLLCCVVMCVTVGGDWMARYKSVLVIFVLLSVVLLVVVLLVSVMPVLLLLVLQLSMVIVAVVMKQTRALK